MDRFTATLAVCLIAAIFTAGALLLNPSPANSKSATPTASTTSPLAADGGTKDGKAGTTAAGGNAELTIADFAFSTLTVSPGATVRVSNNDDVAHTATATSGEFDSGTVAAHATTSFIAPSSPGTYAFVCEIHPQMSGDLVVR